MTAIETCGLKCTLKFVLHKNRAIDSPEVETPTHYVVTGLDEDLNLAAQKAVQNAARFIARHNGLEYEQALMLCGAAVDFRVSQIVDGVKGIHGMIPKTIVHEEGHSFWNEGALYKYVETKI